MSAPQCYASDVVCLSMMMTDPKPILVDEPNSDHRNDVSRYEVSVVLSVHDNAEFVAPTIDSVLNQQDVNLEFIIVDDGATKAVRSVLEKFSDDPRITILKQRNQGLTKALIAGCERASKPFIARIDTGDIMLPGRLRAQAEQLSKNPHQVLVCTTVNVVTPEGYPMYLFVPTRESLMKGLRAVTQDEVLTPFHASVMFLKSIYMAVGGYRPQFYFTQDYDLWSRMIELGEIDVLEGDYTLGLFSAKGISGHHVAEQAALKQIVIELTRARRFGLSESELLLQASRVRPSLRATANDFVGLYFIGKCLLDNKSRHAGEYLSRALAARPWSLKTLYYFLSWRFLNGFFW